MLAAREAIVNNVRPGAAAGAAAAGGAAAGAAAGAEVVVVGSDGFIKR